MRHRFLLHLAAAAALLTFADACGGRGGILIGDELDADNGSGGVGNGAGVGGFNAGGSDAGGAPNGPGAGPGSGPGAGGGGPGSGPGSTGPGSTGPGSTGPGGPQDCIACAAGNCPEAVSCFTDQDCIEGVACGAMNCLDGGNPDPQCFVECFDGDVDAAIDAFLAITCVLQNCGDECGGLLGGFP